MPKFFVKKQPHSPRSRPEPHLGSDHSEPIVDSIDSNQHLDPVRTLLTWSAPSRPFRRKDRSYYTTIAIIIILLILIAILAKEILLIGVLLALTFVTYVLGFVSPGEVDYRISNQGVTIGDHFYFWMELDSFWFSEKEGHIVLNILTRLRFPGQLIIMLGSSEEERVKKVVAEYLPYHEIAPKSMMDKWAEGLQKHFPLENPHR